MLWLAGLASWSCAQYPVGTIYTNDYTDAYGRYRWISLQTESGSVQHGLQTQWRLDGSLYWTLEMSYGQRHGVETYYYDNSIPMSEVGYSNGVVSGWVRYYDPSGIKTYESLYVDSVQHGPFRAWFSESQLSTEGAYYQGQPDGVWRAWYFSPYQLEREVGYSHGVYDGDYRTWYDSGQLHVSARYVAGAPEGEYFENNDKGYPTLTIFYEGGLEASRSEMTYDGSGAVMLYRRDFQESDLVMERSWYGTGSEAFVRRYRGGAYHGTCKAWHPNHVLREETEYIDGSLLHLFRANTNGFRTEEQFWHLTGELESWTRWWYHPNGVQQRESNSDIDGLNHGLVTFWYTNNTLQLRSAYKHGLREGLSEEWEMTGVKRKSEYYRNDLLHGLRSEWATNGLPTEEHVYCDGVYHGPARTWYPSGKPARELLYEYGVLKGPATEYYQWIDGAEHYVYEYGKLHGPYSSDLLSPEGYAQHTTGQYGNGKVWGLWHWWGRKVAYGGYEDYDNTHDYGPGEPVDVPVPPPPDPGVEKKVTGRVYDQATGQPLSLATVNGASTDAHGGYTLTLGDVTDVTLSCSRSGYVTRSLVASLAGVSECTVNVAMRRAPVTVKPTVVSAVSRGGTVFIHGVPCSNTYDVAVTWNGLPPGQLRVIKNGAVSSLSMAGGSLPVSMAMGSEFRPTRDPKGNTLKFVAVSENNVVSEPLILHPVVCQVPGWASSLGPFIAKQTNTVFTYQLNAVWPPSPFELQVNEANMGSTLWTVWSLFPLVGGRNFGIPRTQFFLDTQVDTSGAGSVAAGGQTGFEAGGSEVKVKIGGKGNVQFEPSFGIAWKGADALLSGEGTIKKKVGPINLCPAFEGALQLPMVGRPLRWFNQVAEIEGRIYAGLDLTFPVISEKWGLAFNKANGSIKCGLGLGLTAEVPEVKAEVYGGGEVINYWQVPPGPGGHYLTKIDAKLYGKMVFTVWVYEKTFAIDHVFTHEWTAGGEQADWAALAAPPAPESAAFRPVSRSFLTRGPYNLFVAGRQGVQTAAAHAGAVEQVLIDNVYPLAEPALGGRNASRAIAYTTFNPGRPTLQATDIAVIPASGGGYGSPVIVTNDTRAEFGPAATFDLSGRVVCVWQRVRDTSFASTNLEDMAPQIDLVASVFDPAVNLWSSPQLVTDNTWLERKPLLAASPDGQILLAWLSNSNNLLIGDSTCPDVVHTAWWNPTNRVFERMAALPNTLTNTMAHGLAFDGQHAILTYVQARNDTFDALTNQELACLSWDGATWSSPIPLTSNAVGNISPRVSYVSPGTPLFVWRSGSNLVMRSGTAGPTAIVRSDSGHAGFLDFDVLPAPGGRMVMVWRDRDALGDDLFCRTWDTATGSWSEDLRLTQDEHRERDFTGVVGSNGVLELSYLKTDPATSNDALCALSCPLAYDLAVQTGDLTLDPRFPRPGDTVTLKCVVRNPGDWPVTNASVAFYRGTTNDLLGTAALLPGLLPGGSTGGMAALTWVVPLEATPVNLLAKADPNNAYAERNEGNNQAAAPLFQPDLRISDARCVELAPDMAEFVATVTNAGSLAVTNIQWRFTANGMDLGLQAIARLAAGGSAQVARPVWPDQDFTGGVATVEAIVDPLARITESDESNNTVRFSVVFHEDLDGNGLPDWWEDTYFGEASTNHSATADSDHDGSNDTEEWLAGTDPTNASSRLELSAAAGGSGTNHLFTWGSAAGRQYGVLMTTNLQSSRPWTRLSRFDGTGSLLTYTNRLDYRQVFLKLEVETP